MNLKQHYDNLHILYQLYFVHLIFKSYELHPFYDLFYYVSFHPMRKPFQSHSTLKYDNLHMLLF